ncbi:MAG: reverse transcriptase domain-containing protein [Candidatus Pacearchaeota archaeon]|nr:reverse transcriptase domain-containing protein [Candidatus Pacearchaeota archaeon]
MKKYTNLFDKICSIDNLMLAFEKAKKGKTKRRYVKRFQKNLRPNLIKLRKELLNQTCTPCPLKSFILRDPKTRKISKSAFRDRIVHHAICNIIEPLFDKTFIYDCCANRIGKGTHKALERFDLFSRKVSKNDTRSCFVLKADIRHYFEEVDHSVLINIIHKKINDERVIWLISKILANGFKEKGMPLGNLTSQFFANVYLNELDQFVKHKLRAKYYIRYVDDFVFLHESKEQLETWKKEINEFLQQNLKIELHKNKSQVLRLNKGIKFLGFRVFYSHKLLRKSNVNKFEREFSHLKILFDEGLITREKVLESLEGWLAYCSHANTYKYRKHLIRLFNKNFPFTHHDRIQNKKKCWNFLKRLDESELKFSVQKTLFQFKKGLSIKEIALNRNMKESTIWAHLANLIEHKQISVRDVLPNEKITKILKKVYSKNDSLKTIKKRLKDETNYDEIACVMASIKSKRKQRVS